MLQEVRAVSLTSYVEVARHVGLDPYAMLREVGISPTFLEDPENRCAARPVVELLENSARKSGCDSFGLLMAECRTFTSLGPLSLLLQHLPTVREVLQALVDYRRYMNEIVNAEVEDDGETTVIHLDVVPEFANAQVVELTVAMGHTVLSGASGGRWKPASVHFVRKAPDDVAAFRRQFAAPLHFESHFNGLCCESSSLDIPNPRGDPAMAEHSRRLLKLMKFDREQEPTSDRTRRAIILLLPTGRATLEHAARNLGLGPRGLQRALEREGYSFGALLRETRRELAQRYLTDSARPITTIADLTGYASLSAFGRWFTAEFGMAPQVWRAGHASWAA